MAVEWIINSQGFRVSLEHLIDNVDRATERAIRQSAELIATNAKDSFGPAHLKGTPKTVFDRPQSITGQLRRSIQVVDVTRHGMHGWKSRTAPQTIYGRRIELGFNHNSPGTGGIDSLGRRYEQPPYPFLGPGIKKSLYGIEQIFTQTWQSAV